MLKKIKFPKSSLYGNKTVEIPFDDMFKRRSSFVSNIISFNFWDHETLIRLKLDAIYDIFFNSLALLKPNKKENFKQNLKKSITS